MTIHLSQIKQDVEVETKIQTTITILYTLQAFLSFLFVTMSSSIPFGDSVHKFIPVTHLNNKVQASACCEYCGQVYGQKHKTTTECPGSGKLTFYSPIQGHHHFVLYNGPHEDGVTPIVVCIYCALEPHECTNKVNCTGNSWGRKFANLVLFLVKNYYVKVGQDPFGYEPAHVPDARIVFANNGIRL